MKNVIINSEDCNYSYKSLRGMDIDTSINGTGAASYYLADGTYFAIQIQSDGYAQVIVDANGHKKPNIFGYDIHSYALYTGFRKCRGGLLWAGYGGFNSDTACAKNKTGADCIWLIMKNNWKIPTLEEYKRLGGTEAQYPFTNL
ncbi:MAG: hypothetical protein E7Z91_06605 [Cyanobacteria bacterium SIG30]|nr:hypothetical protein [Cyanobacteria bacterium SIG30]